MSSEFNDAQDSPGFLLWEVTNLWQKKIRQALEPLALTHMQFVLLFSCHWLVSRGGGADITQVQLAQYAHVDVNVTSQVLRVLEQKGYITRSAHLSDTRAKVIAPTPAGTELALRAVQVVEAADREFFSAMGSEREQFIKLMRRLR
ncbi:MAG: MarR family winged helix-turn-helix transcriptional regulator [Sulfobacillus sp.]